MTDIVERLRASAPKMVGAASAHCTDVEAIHLAADEIERLRAACDGAYSWIDRHTAHIGRCDGGDKCTCGRTLVLFELSAALNADGQSQKSES